VQANKLYTSALGVFSDLVASVCVVRALSFEFPRSHYSSTVVPSFRV
jgi:hypothetical protein